MSNTISVGVLPIQAAVATASPSAWLDGLVSDAGEQGVTLSRVDGRSLVLSTAARLAVGEPVAWHPVAEVLANGRTWYSARIAEAEHRDR